MANTAKIKVKCVGLQPATVGSAETVTLQRVFTQNTSEGNAHRLNDVAQSQDLPWVLMIQRGTSAVGQFRLGMTYSVSFTELALEGV